MKRVKQPFVFLGIGFAAWLFLAGCVSQIVRNEMTRRNEADLKLGRITPAQFRQQRDEIDRNLR